MKICHKNISKEVKSKMICRFCIHNAIGKTIKPQVTMGTCEASDKFSPPCSCWQCTVTHLVQWIAIPWWRHQMETYSALLAFCVGNSPVIGEFSAQRPVTRSFDVFFDQHQNKWLSKQSWGWWFKTPSCPSWRHYNGHTSHIASQCISCKTYHWSWLCDI